MSEEKPLHVVVATALRHECSKQEETQGEQTGWFCNWCEGVDYVHQSGDRLVHRYDTDWSVTGPLIQRYRITLTPLVSGAWLATSKERSHEAETPLEAVCYLIWDLAKEGELIQERKEHYRQVAGGPWEKVS